MTIFDYLVLGLSHGAYVIGLVLMLSAVFFILAFCYSIILSFSGEEDEEEEEEGEER